MPTSLDALATTEAVAGNLNLIEFTREDTRWQRPHTILEVDGVMLFAGASDFPAYNNGVHRIDDTTPGAEVIARAGEFFAARGAATRSGCATPVRTTTSRAAADAASIAEFADSPQMICRTRLPEEPLPAGVEIRMVEDLAGTAIYADICGRAYVSLGSPDEATRSHFNGPTAMLAPHVHSAIAYLDGAPVSCAQILMSHGIAGVYWVASLEPRAGAGSPRPSPATSRTWASTWGRATSSCRPPRWASRSTPAWATRSSTAASSASRCPPPDRERI